MTVRKMVRPAALPMIHADDDRFWIDRTGHPFSGYGGVPYYVSWCHLEELVEVDGRMCCEECKAVETWAAPDRRPVLEMPTFTADITRRMTRDELDMTPRPAAGSSILPPARDTAAFAEWLIQRMAVHIAEVTATVNTWDLTLTNLVVANERREGGFAFNGLTDLSLTPEEFGSAVLLVAHWENAVHEFEATRARVKA